MSLPHIKSSKLKLNGQIIDGLSPSCVIDVDSGESQLHYLKLCRTMQKWGSSNDNLALTEDQFLTSYYLLSADLTNTGSISSNSLPMVKQGRLSMNLILSQPLIESYIAIVWLMTPNLLLTRPGELPSLSTQYQG